MNIVVYRLLIGDFNYICKKNSMIIQYIHWTVNPDIINTTLDLPFIGAFHLVVRYYSILFALGFVFGYYIMRYFFKKENIDGKLLDSLTTFMFIGTVLGARLGHVIFYEPAYYFSHPIEILKTWNGGLASHGAAIGILLSLWWFHKKSKKPYLWIIDRIVIVVALAGALIRLGNLMNSEIYGHATTLPWAFIFERADALMLPRHPTQIYEALAYFLIFGFLFSYYQKREGKTLQGVLLGWFFILVFGFRFFVEFFKENQVDFETNLTLNMGQSLSIPFVILGIVLIYFAQKDKLPKFLTQ